MSILTTRQSGGARELIGDINDDPGSKYWSIAVREQIRAYLQDAKQSVNHLESSIGAMIRFEGWRVLTDAIDTPFTSFEAFCRHRYPWGLGYDPTALDALIAERTRKQSPAEMAETPKAIRPEGRPGDTSNCVDNTVSAQGPDAEYLTARIARDAPDVLDRMKAGEFASVRAAASAAGLVKPRISISLTDPCAAARSISRRSDRDFISELIAELHHVADGMEN